MSNHILDLRLANFTHKKWIQHMEQTYYGLENKAYPWRKEIIGVLLIVLTIISL